MNKKKRIRIIYDGKPNDELTETLAGVIEFPPFNYSWKKQGYDSDTDISYIEFGKKRANTLTG